MNLANVIYTQGQCAAVATLYRDTLKVANRVLGPEHPDTLMTAGNLATTLSRQGQHA